MKLRNKKTGELVEVFNIGLVWNKYGMPANIGQYKNLAELNEEWEDYDPKEPLIKYEKVRKAVRAWAEAECITKAYLENDYTICRDDDVDVSISFCVPVFKDVGGYI